MYLSLAELGLSCFEGFSLDAERGGFSFRWLLLRSTLLGALASVVTARGLSSCPTRHQTWAPCTGSVGS